MDILQDFIIIPRPANDMVVVGCVPNRVAKLACCPGFDGTNHLVYRRAGCPHPAAVFGCMNVQNDMKMVWHNDIGINGNIFVNRFRAAYQIVHDFPGRQQLNSRRDEGIPPYRLRVSSDNTGKDVLLVFGAHRYKIRTRFGVIVIFQPRMLSFRQTIHHSNRIVTLLAWACRPSCSAKSAMRLCTSLKASRV